MKKKKLIELKKLFKKKGVLDSVIFHKRFDNKKDHLNLIKK